MNRRNARLAVQSWLRTRGIEVRKAPARLSHLPVFPMAIETIMARRGRSLHFVQVGANDGRFVDPLHDYVTSCGWRGVLVEPQADVFARLKQNYAGLSDRLIFENVAISPEAMLTLYLPPTDMAEDRRTYAQSVVSTSNSIVANQAGVDKTLLRSVDVPAITLDALFAKHRITELDLLQIDCEGYDWEVLQTLDLAVVRPLLIQVEAGHLDRPSLTDMVGHLNDEGYLVYYGGHEGDTIAMRADVALTRPR